MSLLKFHNIQRHLYKKISIVYNIIKNIFVIFMKTLKNHTYS